MRVKDIHDGMTKLRRLCMVQPYNRGSALPSATKSNKSHYQFKVFVCVSVISGHTQIIARMWTIGVLI